MSCKYPKESRMYYACIICPDKNICSDTITNLQQANYNVPMSEIQPSQNVILSASEANKMTNDVINNCITQQLVKLSGLIKDAIANGKFLIRKDGCLESGTRKNLEELGYKVDVGTQYNTSYYNISWKEAK